MAGTDGLFDNLFESDILNFVKKTNDPIICAKAIADAAMRNAKDKTVYLKICRSPNHILQKKKKNQLPPGVDTILTIPFAIIKSFGSSAN